MSTFERKGFVALTGGGGREAVQVDMLLKSPHVDKVAVFPGNDMMKEGREDRVLTFPQIRQDEVNKIIRAARELGVTHVVPSQDNAIQAGLGDIAKLYDMKVAGPTSAAGRIEWDKEYARDLGDYIGIPQPTYAAFSHLAEADEYLKDLPEITRFVKAAGLAEGKGVIGTHSHAEVFEAIGRLKEEHPQAARRFLIETGLVGEEFSTFFVSDGINFKIVGSAQDHKREYDGDLGENTGGMGAVSHPLLLKNTKLQYEVNGDIYKLLSAKRKEGNPFVGWGFYGGMAVPIGILGELAANLIEWNAREGDPEAQTIDSGLLVDRFELIDAMANGDISKLDIRDDGKVRLAVAVASQGYPRNYHTARGAEIKSIPELKRLDDINIYGAGVEIVGGKYIVNGGRVFYLQTDGEDIIDARRKMEPALVIVAGMDGHSLRFRTDIGWRDVVRLQNRV